MKKRYMYAKVNKYNLYAVLDYCEDKLIRWCTDIETAKELTEALNKAEESYEPGEIERNIPFFNT